MAAPLEKLDTLYGLLERTQELQVSFHYLLNLQIDNVELLAKAQAIDTELRQLIQEAEVELDNSNGR